jgi:hypothetical protein
VLLLVSAASFVTKRKDWREKLADAESGDS